MDDFLNPGAQWAAECKFLMIELGASLQNRPSDSRGIEETTTTALKIIDAQSRIIATLGERINTLENQITQKR